MKRHFEYLIKYLINDIFCWNSGIYKKEECSDCGLTNVRNKLILIKHIYWTFNRIDTYRRVVQRVTIIIYLYSLYVIYMCMYIYLHIYTYITEIRAFTRREETIVLYLHL